MRVIIAGSREIKSHLLDVDSIIYNSGFDVTEVVCGECRGADLAGKNWAVIHKPDSIPVKSFPAEWDKHGKAAGPIRNRQMAEYSDAAIIIYKGRVTRGSKNMVDSMRKLSKPVFVCFAEDYTNY